MLKTHWMLKNSFYFPYCRPFETYILKTFTISKHSTISPKWLEICCSRFHDGTFIDSQTQQNFRMQRIPFVKVSGFSFVLIPHTTFQNNCQRKRCFRCPGNTHVSINLLPSVNDKWMLIKYIARLIYQTHPLI